MSMLRRLSLIVPLLAGLVLAGPAAASAFFDARITIRSQCSVQKALFGPAAQGAATVICNPGTTPYQSRAVVFGESAETPAPASDAGGQPLADGSYAPAQFRPNEHEILPPPSSRSASSSRLIYVIF